MVAIKLIDIDARPLSFGKHKGSTPNDVAAESPHYIVWLYENIEPKVCSKDLYLIASEDAREENAHGADEGDRWSIY